MEFFDEDLVFYPIFDSPDSYYAAQFQQKTALKIKSLPSNTRLVLQLIVLPEKKKLLETKLPKREGLIFGSVSIPLFDMYRRMRQG